MSPPIIRFAKLPVNLPLSALKAEAAALPVAWKAHLNKAHYQGGWTVISLRAPGGNPEHTVADVLGQASYADTPLMALTPVLQAFLHTLPFPLWSVRLLRLAPGSFIKEHRDMDLSFEQGEVRLHFPLLTHEDVAFMVEGERVHMREGECWYINANLPHSVSNPGPGDRIHLVVDGVVTSELQELFRNGEVRYSEGVAAFKEQEAVIRELRLRGETAWADQLEASLLDTTAAAPSFSKTTHGAEGTANVLCNWIPASLLRSDGEWLCRWMDMGDVLFTAPFFDETLNICRNQPANRKPFQVLGSVPSMMEWAEEMLSVMPSAFLFHVSRCGSTLAAQLLGLDPRHIVLAEAPFIDDLLRAGYRVPGEALPDVEGAIRAALRFYGQQRQGPVTRLFIKTDSWHILFHAVLRAAYPNVPFFLLYRSPEEVLYSHRKRRGMQSVPGVIERDILWAPAEKNGAPQATGELDAYMADVLFRYMEKFLAIAQEDPLSYLVNYAEGIPSIVERIAKVTNTPIDAGLRAQMTERSRFHAKDPTQVFSEEAGSDLPEALLTPLFALYGQLEERRRANT